MHGFHRKTYASSEQKNRNFVSINNNCSSIIFYRTFDTLPWLIPENVEMYLSGVKGNLYALFFGEGKRVIAVSYPTKEGKEEQFP